MINWLIGNTQRIKKSPMLHVLRVLPNAASEEIDFNAEQVYDPLVGKISP
jgi:hypothetical protein